MASHDSWWHFLARNMQHQCVLLAPASLRLQTAWTAVTTFTYWYNICCALLHKAILLHPVCARPSHMLFCTFISMHSSSLFARWQCWMKFKCWQTRLGGGAGPGQSLACQLAASTLVATQQQPASSSSWLRTVVTNCPSTATSGCHPWCVNLTPCRG